MYTDLFFVIYRSEIWVDYLLQSVIRHWSSWLKQIIRTYQAFTSPHLAVFQGFMSPATTSLFIAILRSPAFQRRAGRHVQAHISRISGRSKMQPGKVFLPKQRVKCVLFHKADSIITHNKQSTCFAVECDVCHFSLFLHLRHQLLFSDYSIIDEAWRATMRAAVRSAFLGLLINSAAQTYPNLDGDCV